MYDVDFIGHFAFCNYRKWPLRFNSQDGRHMEFLAIFLQFRFPWIWAISRTL